MNFPSWTEEEDLCLAEAVLRHLREGRNEMSAFHEVSRLLRKGVDQISNRWITAVKPRYKQAVVMAEKMGEQRRMSLSETPSAIETTPVNPEPSPEPVTDSIDTPDISKKVRSDAWTDKDDEVLVNTVLKHIKEGSTQLNAFEEVGDLLERTTAAVGFRWNGVVRKQYEQQIAEAKREYRKAERAKKEIPNLTFISYPTEKINIKPLQSFAITEQKEPVTVAETKQVIPSDEKPKVSFEDVIAFLIRQSQEQGHLLPSKETEKKYLQLEAQYKSLLEKYNLLKEAYREMEDEHMIVMRIMEKAQKFGSLEQNQA